jgi:phosphate transport system substrate-binding protein
MKTNFRRINIMRRINTSIFVVLIISSILLSACGSAATPAAIEVMAPAATEGTVVPTAAKPTALPPGSVQIIGAGATFPLPIYTEWTYAYQYVDPSVVINYQGIGSGGGKKAIIDNTVDFAGSDSLLKDEEYAAGKDLQMYPELAGAVVPIYNIEGITSEDATLILNGNSLVGIYNATIKKWNDPALVVLNPDLKDKLPDKAIVAVHRADGSGTTEIFTKALTSFSPDWTAGGASSIEWPVDKAGNGIGGKGNPGVAAAVMNTPNSIGYVELSYAIANKILFAQVVNKAGKTVKASAESLVSAMNDFADMFDAKLTNTIVDAPGEKSWPISAYTYIILHTTSMTDCVKAQKLLEYLNWTLTDAGASKRAADLGYAVLPETVQKMVLAKLGEVTCNGKPVITAP